MPDTKPEAPASAPAAPTGTGRALLVAVAGAAFLALLLRSSKAAAQPLLEAPPGVPPDKWALYGQLVNRVADEVGIPASALAAVVTNESGWNNNGSNNSKCGVSCTSRYEPRLDECSIGLTQVLASTSRSLGVDPSRLCDPYWGLRAGALYLKRQYDTFGDWNTVFAAYNAGPGRAENPPAKTVDYAQRASSNQAQYQRAGLSGLKLFRVRA